jgi:tetratricopeptide (TPR) repeat protein
MPQELIQLDAKTRSIRIALVVLIVCATLWSYFAFRWYLGNTMAEYFNTAQNNLELAHVAQKLAPNDPLTNWRLAEVSQKTLPLDQSAVAVSQFEKAAGLSPNDYRFWVSLGIAREQTGDTSGAEQALRRAVALAPFYANPRWHLGNLLLRIGRYDEAFAELRTASEADPDGLRPQMFNLVWEVNNSDFESMLKGVGSQPESRAQFALYMLGQKRIDEGLRVWNSLKEDEKKANKATGDSILATLIANARFHDALNVWNDLVPTPAYRAEEGKNTDGGFEDQISYTPDYVFAWQVKTVGQMEIGIDPAVSHNGSRSLRLLFQVRSQLDAINAAQIVAVAKNAQYDFECYVKTKDLKSGAPPVIQIVDLNSGSTLASSDPAPTDTDWKPIVLSFKTSDKTEAIAIRISRVACDDAKMCPIFGTIWYDDFSLKRN